MITIPVVVPKLTCGRHKGNLWPSLLLVLWRYDWVNRLLKWRLRWSMLGFKQVRRVIIFVVGMTVLLFGVALLVLPGPAILVIPAGLAILGLEFRWARRWMRRARVMIRSGETRFFRRNGNQPIRGKVNGGSLGMRGIEAAKLDEGQREKSHTNEQEPEAAFGDGQDHSQPDQERKHQVNRDGGQQFHDPIITANRGLARVRASTGVCAVGERSQDALSVDVDQK
jgi:hypothetical protein